RSLAAHVAEPAGEFRKPLAVGAVADPVDREVRGLHELGAREERDDWFGIELRHCVWPVPVGCAESYVAAANGTNLRTRTRSTSDRKTWLLQSASRPAMVSVRTSARVIFTLPPWCSI